MRICVICEGCYPFVMGGVSSWLQGLIQAMPQHEFSIWAIGAEQKKRGHFAYQLPSNVVELKDVYLDSVLTEPMGNPALVRRRFTGEQRTAVRELFQCGQPDWSVLFRLFHKRRMDNVAFLLQEEFLSILEDICKTDYPFVGFTDYFWTVRSMFLPLLYLLGDEPPKADLYYAISAGYACWVPWQASFFTSRSSLRSMEFIRGSARRKFFARNGFPLTLRICGSTCFTCLPAAPI